MSLSGAISVRERELFGPDVADWPAWRAPEEITDMPAADYIGVDLDPGRRGEVPA